MDISSVRSLIHTQAGGYAGFRGEVWTEVKIVEPSIYRRYLKPWNWTKMLALFTNTKKSLKERKSGRDGGTGMLRPAA